MSGNRSLDEFAGAGSAEDRPDGDRPDDDRLEPAADDGEAPAAAGTHAGGEAGGEPGTDDGGAGAVEPAADDEVAAEREPPERPASTYTWHPDGAECAACGAAVEERWRDGDGLVCADCKEW